MLNLLWSLPCGGGGCTLQSIMCVCVIAVNLTMRIALLEDDPRFGPLVKEHLEAGGCSVELSTKVAEFENLIATCSDFDALIVDLGLPDGDGLDFVRSYRKRGGTTPIIIVTARNMVKDLVQALDGGADDFVTKPVHIDVLRARIRAVMRRPKLLAARTHCVGGLMLDQETGEIRFQNGEVGLSPAERRLLALLMRRAGSVVSKNMIDGKLYGADRPNSANAVEQLVSRLRRSLARCKSGVDVKTVRGIGYVLEERPS